MHKLLFLASLSLLAPAVVAQEVTFRGKVEDVSGTQNQFFLDCTDVDLSSSLFNLNLFVGLQVEITGIWNGSSTSPSVVVTELAPVAETFEIGGGAKIGESVTFAIDGPPGAFAAAFFSLDSDFVSLRQGVLLIDLAQGSKVGQGTIPAIGRIEFGGFIPNDPSLVGIVGYGQGFFLSGGQVTITNPDCKEVDA